MTPSIRHATEADLRFCHSSWHTNYWKVYAHKHIERDVYARGQDQRIDRLLADATVLVAYFPEVEDEVLGWVAFERDALYYVYVKGTYRKAGIASGLVQNLGCKWYTHQTNEAGRAFLARFGMQFNPYKMET